MYIVVLDYVDMPVSLLIRQFNMHIFFAGAVILIMLIDRNYLLKHASPCMRAPCAEFAVVRVRPSTLAQVQYCCAMHTYISAANSDGGCHLVTAKIIIMLNRYRRALLQSTGLGGHGSIIFLL